MCCKSQLSAYRKCIFIIYSRDNALLLTAYYNFSYTCYTRHGYTWYINDLTTTDVHNVSHSVAYLFQNQNPGRITATFKKLKKPSVETFDHYYLYIRYNMYVHICIYLTHLDLFFLGSTVKLKVFVLGRRPTRIKQHAIMFLTFAVLLWRRIRRMRRYTNIEIYNIIL